MHESNWLSCFIFDQELDYVVEELEKIAVVHLLQNRSIISLIGNVQRSSLILEKVLYLIPNLPLLLRFPVLIVLYWILLSYDYLGPYLLPSSSSSGTSVFNHSYSALLTSILTAWHVIAGISCSSNPWGHCSDDLSGRI